MLGGLTELIPLDIGSAHCQELIPIQLGQPNEVVPWVLGGLTELIPVDHGSAQDVLENAARWNNIHVLSLNKLWMMTLPTVFMSNDHTSLIKQS
jgi:hypothetical protein